MLYTFSHFQLNNFCSLRINNNSQLIGLFTFKFSINLRATFLTPFLLCPVFINFYSYSVCDDLFLNAQRLLLSVFVCQKFDRLLPETCMKLRLTQILRKVRCFSCGRVISILLGHFFWRSLALKHQNTHSIFSSHPNKFSPEFKFLLLMWFLCIATGNH